MRVTVPLGKSSKVQYNTFALWDHDRMLLKGMLKFRRPLGKCILSLSHTLVTQIRRAIPLKVSLENMLEEHWSLKGMPSRAKDIKLHRQRQKRMAAGTTGYVDRRPLQPSEGSICSRSSSSSCVPFQPFEALHSYTIICATPCPPSVLLLMNSWCFRPARA